MVKPIYLFTNTCKILFNVIKMMLIPLFNKENNLLKKQSTKADYNTVI